MHIIENDIFINQDQSKSKKVNFKILEENNDFSNKLFRSEGNPMKRIDTDFLIKKSLSFGFNFIGSKTLIESQEINETVYRVERYLIFEK